MNTPAEVARAPGGATCTITGKVELSISETISRVESSSPPGVSSSMRTATALADSATAIPSRRWRLIGGVIGPLTSRRSTRAGSAAWAKPASARRIWRATRTASLNPRRGAIAAP